MKRLYSLFGSALLLGAGSAQLLPKLQPVYLPPIVESTDGTFPVDSAALMGDDGKLYLFDPTTKEFFTIGMPTEQDAKDACDGSEYAHTANMLTETGHRTGAPVGIDYDGFAVCAPEKGEIIKKVTAIYTVPDLSTGEYTVNVTVDGEPYPLH